MSQFHNFHFCIYCRGFVPFSSTEHRRSRGDNNSTSRRCARGHRRGALNGAIVGTEQKCWRVASNNSTVYGSPAGDAYRRASRAGVHSNDPPGGETAGGFAAVSAVICLGCRDPGGIRRTLNMSRVNVAVAGG